MGASRSSAAQTRSPTPSGEEPTQDSRAVHQAPVDCWPPTPAKRPNPRPGPDDTIGHASGPVHPCTARRDGARRRAVDCWMARCGGPRQGRIPRLLLRAGWFVLLWERGQSASRLPLLPGARRAKAERPDHITGFGGCHQLHRPHRTASHAEPTQPARSAPRVQRPPRGTARFPRRKPIMAHSVQQRSTLDVRAPDLAARSSAPVRAQLIGAGVSPPTSPRSSIQEPRSTTPAVGRFRGIP